MASRKVLKVMQQARQGEAAACLLLGQCYLRGEEGLGSNFQAAWRWLSLAAEKGLDEALPLIIQGEELRREACCSLLSVHAKLFCTEPPSKVSL